MSKEQKKTGEANKKNASDRLDQIENAFMGLYHTLDNVARDLITSKEAIKLLGNKVDAMVKLISRGDTLTDDSISKVMIENNVEELKGKIDGLVEKGVLVAQETVDENSFVVGREIDQEGTVMNPRLQFALKAVPEPTREKIKGSKPGDVLIIEEGKLRFEVLETYTISPAKEESSENVVSQTLEATGESTGAQPSSEELKDEQNPAQENV